MGLNGHSAGVDVPHVLCELGHPSQGLVARRSLQRAGVSDGALTRALAAGTVVRVLPRVYAVAPLPPRGRFVVTEAGPSASYVGRVRAVLLGLGDAATAAGRTAAALYGWGMLVEPTVTQIAVPHGRSRTAVPDARVVQRRSVERTGVVAVPNTDPLRVTSPVQTVLDCARELPLLQAVVLCDSALRAGAVTVEQLRRAAARLGGVRHAGKVARVVDLCDPESGSVLESVLRVRMMLGGLTGFDTQRVIRDLPGGSLRVDFCFVACGLVVEVDGARWHPDPERDQRRDNALAALGWRVLRFTWADVVHDAQRVLAEIAVAATSGGPSFHLRAGSHVRAA